VFAARYKALRGCGWHRKDECVRRVERQHLSAEIEGGGAALGKSNGAQPVLEMDLGTTLDKICQGRIDEGRRQALAGNQRTAGAPSLGEGFPHHGGGKLR